LHPFIAVRDELLFTLIGPWLAKLAKAEAFRYREKFAHFPELHPENSHELSYHA
jgi:hypothetical protein